MLRSTRPSNLPILAGFLAIGIALGCAPAADFPGGFEGAIPDEFSGWQAAGEVVHYDTESIFDYIDGHAEVYLAYGMKRSLARRFTGPAGEGDIVLDLFELASPEDAFGVFTHDLDGVPVGIGNDSRLRYGWLSFWQGPWFVSVSSEMESDRASQAVLELGQAIADLLPAGGVAPEVVKALPVEGLDAQSVRFLRHRNILNTHYWMGDEDVFGLGPETAAALGTYDFEGTRGRLLIVDYESDQAANSASERFTARFLAGVGGEVIAFEDRGWFGVSSSGSRVVAALGADSSELANWLLDEAIGGAL